MKWKISPQFNYKEWHRWFAWYPVKLKNNQRVWLEYVERKLDGYTIDYIACWSYRSLN